MKKLIATLLLTVCLSSVALAGDIPGSGPVPPPCTENCPSAQPADDENFIGTLVMGLYSLVF